MELTDQELNTVMLALRTLQRQLEDGEMCDPMGLGDAHPILSPEEIDDLCERLNFGE